MPELRNITPDEFERWMATESRAHGNRLAHDPEQLRPRFDLERSIAVFEDGQIVGGCHSHLLEMSIPGGTSPWWPGCPTWRCSPPTPGGAS